MDQLAPDTPAKGTVPPAGKRLTGVGTERDTPAMSDTATFPLADFFTHYSVGKALCPAATPGGRP